MSWTKITKTETTFVPIAVIPTTFTKIAKPTVTWTAPFGIYPLSFPKQWDLGQFAWNKVTSKWGD